MIFLIGSKAGYSRELRSIVSEALNRDVVLIDNLLAPRNRTDFWGFDPSDFQNMDQNYVLCPSPPGVRWLIEQELAARAVRPHQALLHPSASVDTSSTLSPGTSVNRLVSIGSGTRIGGHCQVNRSASIGHDCRIEDFVTIGPGAIIAGGVTIRSGAFIGAGAVIIEGLEIGSNSVVGAGAVVIRHVAPLTLSAGNPAKLIKKLVSGYKGFSV